MPQNSVANLANFFDLLVKTLAFHTYSGYDKQQQHFKFALSFKMAATFRRKKVTSICHSPSFRTHNILFSAVFHFVVQHRKYSPVASPSCDHLISFLLQPLLIPRVRTYTLLVIVSTWGRMSLISFPPPPSEREEEHNNSRRKRNLAGCKYYVLGFFFYRKYIFVRSPTPRSTMYQFWNGHPYSHKPKHECYLMAFNSLGWQKIHFTLTPFCIGGVVRDRAKSTLYRVFSRALGGCENRRAN